jgi:DNA-binding transcriptional LysR family regulator
MINYTLKQMYSYEAVIRLKSFTKASQELHITQPAVYMQIKQLQESLGSELISIQGKAIRPTFIGKKFYQTSLDIIDKLEQSKAEIEQTLDPEAGHLQIAVATTTNSFVSQILAKFKKQYPRMSFYLDVTNRESLLTKLSNSEVDLIIMGEPPTNMSLITQPFMENPLIAIAHPEHPLLNNKNNTISDLTHETLITREQGSGTRITIERIIGMQLNSDIEINSNEAIIQAVQAGLGIGFVSKHTVKLELENNVIKQLDIDKFPITRHWYVVHHSKNKLSPIAERFKEFIVANS